MISLPRLAYSLTLLLASPLILLRLLWRGFLQRGYWKNIGERWGFFLPSDHFVDGGCIWIHAVSVGEMRATQPLVKSLQAHFPDRSFLFSCMTATGREVANELYGQPGKRTQCIYLPYDFFGLQRRAIAQFKPAILLVMETEIWPNLLAACRTKGIPTVLVNARLSEKSFQGYSRFAPVRALVTEALASMNVCAQFPGDANRLASLGAKHPVVTGNIKFDVLVEPAMMLRGRDWRRNVGTTRRVLLAASTREGEEPLLLSAFARIFSAAEREQVLLVVVPRHPQRFEAVFELLKAASLAATRRTDEAPNELTAVWLGDSMGEMAAYIAACDVAFIGGSLLPLGGQNLIEACAQGKPVVMGPSTFNFSDAARLALESGAMRQGANADQVMEHAKALLFDPVQYAAAAGAASAFAAEHAGATQKTMGLIAPLLDPAKN